MSPLPVHRSSAQHPILLHLKHLFDEDPSLSHDWDTSACTLGSSHPVRINRVLLGGSSKALYPCLLRSSPPLALQDPADPSRIITGPSDVRAATVSYFSELYHHLELISSPKPWLSTPSLHALRTRVNAHSTPCVTTSRVCARSPAMRAMHPVL